MILSIIIPTFNRVNFLQRMVNSVLKQISQYYLHAEVEIVISDNCSTDGTQQYIQDLIKEYPSVHVAYNRNETNIGVVRNIVKLMQLAQGEFCMFYGDDDLMCNGALPKIITTLKENASLAVFVFKQKNFSEIVATERLSIYECAARYFNYMGNACSAWRTDLAKSNIEKHYQSIVSTCWPHTHVMYLGMYSLGCSKPALASNVEVYEEQVKDDNNIVNSFYLFDSKLYSLLRLGEWIAEFNADPAFYKAFGKGIVVLRKSNYLSFCCYLIHTNKAYCTRKEKDEFRKTLKESLKEVKGTYKKYLFPLVTFNAIPSKIYLWLYLNGKSLYIFLKRDNHHSLKKNYSKLKASLEKVKENRVKNMQKKHSLIINKGEW